MAEILVLASIAATIAAGAAALVDPIAARLSRSLSFALLGLSGAGGVATAVVMLMGAEGFQMTIPFGLPWLQWHLRLDPLGGLFLGIIGFVVSAIALYAPAYVREYARHSYSIVTLNLFTSLFVLGMQLVVLADDALTFMIAWELMSVTSYLLVVYEHLESANRRAALIYLVMAQVGALLILLAFGVMVGFGGGFTFAAMSEAPLTLFWSSIAFVLALLGFGMKAGLVPLHVWLPEAHPVAPSHISALMSGVMLKVAVYGFIRVVFELIGDLHWSWGVGLLVIGSITALYGVLYALMQHDLKRLLAYHSVENIGIIFIGLGLSALFFGSDLPTLGTLGLIAALYHTINHAVFKSLLFLGAGVVVQRGHERNLELMGGLIHRMPWTALFFLIGCISIAALPPFNGFVSEWLTLQTALQALSLENEVLRSTVPISAAMLALTGALAAACFVKVYGIAFLGQARGRRVRHAHEASHGMVTSQGLLAGACLLLGVFPTTIVEGLNRVTGELMGSTLTAATREGWLWLTPVSPHVASYSAPLVTLGVSIALAAWALIYFGARKRRKLTPVPRVDTWDCGFGSINARMQYGASAFAMPIRTVFKPVLGVEEHIVRDMHEEMATLPATLRHQSHSNDLCWPAIYQPIERWVIWASRRISRLQTGQLRHYLAYSFFTLLALLWLI